ncbi:MAG: twin-arginine translocase TatA/TatE family subunit [bacterium]|nr:twin-arginine translocase TatA/TatE family subunit [bacterium]
MKISMQELLIILMIVVIIFGPRQIPKLSKMFGKTVRNFKDGVNNTNEDELEI